MRTPPARRPDPAGSTRWYAWAVYFPAIFAESAEANHWLDITQSKGEYSGSPAVAVGVKGHQLVLDGKHITGPLGQLIRGRWIDLRVGIHFSAVTTAGWVNGRGLTGEPCYL